MVGWRTDDQIGRERVGNNRLPSFEWDPANLELGDALPVESGDTFTWSLVGHVPVELPLKTRVSFHYNESENFQPVGTCRTVYGDPLGPPTGASKEEGISFEMFDNRLAIRLNWFETSNTNGSAGIGDISKHWQ